MLITYLFSSFFSLLVCYINITKRVKINRITLKINTLNNLPMERIFLIAATLIALVNINYLSIVLQGGVVESNKYIGGIFMSFMILLFMRNYSSKKYRVFKTFLVVLSFINMLVFCFKAI